MPCAVPTTYVLIENPHLMRCRAKHQAEDILDPAEDARQKQDSTRWCLNHGYFDVYKWTPARGRK